MIFNRLNITCPKCQKSNLYSQDKTKNNSYINENGAKIDDNNEYSITCDRNKCKFDFIVSTQLNPGELLFAEHILQRGIQEGIWYVECWVGGGAGKNRTAAGIDFQLYNRIGGVGGTLLLEHKDTPIYEFTETQMERFLLSKDTTWRATRFCGLRHMKHNPELINMVSYFTPNFFRIIPLTNFHKSLSKRDIKGTNYALSFAGLNESIKQNCYTELHETYSEETLDNLLSQFTNTNIFKINHGQFGYPGSEYEPIKRELAYEILYLKLKNTVHNLGEDIDRKYALINSTIPVRQQILKHIDKLVYESLANSYRALYPIDVSYTLRNDQFLSLHFAEEGPIRFKGAKRILTGELVDRFLAGVRKGLFQEISIPDYPIKSYGLKGVNYIPLTRGASQILDAICFSVNTIEEEVRVDQIAEKMKINKHHLNRRIWEFGIELIEKNLIYLEKRSFRQKSTQFLSLTERGFNYFHRLNEFSDSTGKMGKRN